MQESMAALTLSTNNNHIGGPTNGILAGEIRQLFSLPESIIYYIAMNPSNANVYKKLIRTCKYFFNKNPILVVSALCCNVNTDDEWKVLLEEASNTLTQGEKEDYFDVAQKKRIDMKTLPYKLWVTQYASIFTHHKKHEKYAASIMPKLYRSDADYVELKGQILTVDGLVLLASNASKCLLWKNTITEKDGKSEVAFEKVIEKLTQLRDIKWVCNKACECFSADTVNELLKLQHFGNVTDFTMQSIPHECFDATALFDYVKTSNKNMKLCLTYDTEKSSAKFKKEIEEIVDEVIGSEDFNYMPPVIYDCRFIEREKQQKMEQTANIYPDDSNMRLSYISSSNEMYVTFE